MVSGSNPIRGRQQHIKIITKDFFCNCPQRENDKCIMVEIIKKRVNNKTNDTNECISCPLTSFVH